EEVGLEQAFLQSVNNENWVEAEALAPRLLSTQPAHRSAHTFMGLVDFKAGNYAQSNQHFLSAGGSPISELTGILARAWVYQAQGRTEEALGILEAPNQPDWAQFFLRYHRALLTDVAGRTAAARVAYDRMPKESQRFLRVSLAFAHHAANTG